MHIKKIHIQSHHLYLGIGSIVAIAALVVVLTFGLSHAQKAAPSPLAERASAAATPSD